MIQLPHGWRFILIFLGVTYLPVFRRFENFILVFAVLLTSGGYIIMGLMAPIRVHAVYSVGLLVCLIFNYCFIRLPFIHALSTGVFVCVTYCLVIVRWGTLLKIEEFAYIVCILCVQPILAAICYTSELANRRNFFLMELLSRQHKEIKNANAKLKEALDQVKLLSGLLPICSSCKKIRDDKGDWNQIEVYIRDHSEAEFSHSICPKCAKKTISRL